MQSDIFKINAKLIEVRKELHKNSKMVDLELNLPEDLYNSILELCLEEKISIEDYIVNLITNDIIKNTPCQEELTGGVIDEAIVSIYAEELINSNKDYLVVSNLDYKPKVVLLTNSNSVLNFEFKKTD